MYKDTMRPMGNQQLEKKKGTKKQEKMNDFMEAHKELQGILLEEGSEQYETIKPLRKYKHDLRGSVIDTKLDNINFHTYETHDVSDLLIDINNDEGADEEILNALDNFLH